MTLVNPFGELALEGTLADARDRLLDTTGTPALAAGVNGGTVSIPAGARLLAVSVTAVDLDGTFTVDSQPAITCRNDRSIDWAPRAAWLGPFDIVFSGSLDYVVEWTV